MVPMTFLSLWWLMLVSVIVSADGWLWLGGQQQRKVGGDPQQGKMMAGQYSGPAYLYRPEAASWSPQYTYDNAPVPPMTVALPFAVPLNAQMGGMSGGLKSSQHPVQLVPCLCPISRDDGQQGQQQPAAPAFHQQQQSQQQTSPP